ncbi:hypothetical protein M0804_001891 [Polistes exclamans]|nr:hypothetical protein M0804_001891 [Polistes exclamans]
MSRMDGYRDTKEHSLEGPELRLPRTIAKSSDNSMTYGRFTYINRFASIPYLAICYLILDSNENRRARHFYDDNGVRGIKLRRWRAEEWKELGASTRSNGSRRWSRLDDGDDDDDGEDEDDEDEDEDENEDEDEVEEEEDEEGGAAGCAVLRSERCCWFDGRGTTAPSPSLPT